MRAVTTDGRALTFFRDNNIISSSLEAREGFAETMLVESDAFDDVIAQHRPDVVVLDVEGAEVEILSNSSLHGINDIIVEIHPHITGPDKTAEMLHILQARGFQAKDTARKTMHLRAGGP